MLIQCSMSSLPRNFQDAIIVTRALGYNYLWVDSLCIIQNSLDDWGHESSRMAGVYKYAALTIVPTSATSCHDGFLHPRSSFRRARIPYIHPRTGISDGHLILQLTDNLAYQWDREIEDTLWNSRGWTFQERLLSRRILHFCSERSYFECKVWDDARVEGDGRPGPLMSAMSVFNMEALAGSSGKRKDLTADHSCGTESSPHEGLSARMASSPVVSEDKASTSDETTQQLQPCEDEGRSEISEDEYDAYQPFQQWYRAVRIYSERCLTYKQDKFPAAEGLARDLASKCNVGRYFAGIWEFDLALGLLWKPSPRSVVREDFGQRPVWSWPPLPPEKQQQQQPTLPSPPQPPGSEETLAQPGAAYRAPSWSWASRDTLTHWPAYPCHEWEVVPPSELDLLNGEIELQDVRLELAGESPFGRLTGAYLTLRAKYRRISVSGPHKLEETRLQTFPANISVVFLSDFVHGIHGETGHFGYACFDTGSAPPEGDVFVLRTIHQAPGYAAIGLWSGLVLQESEEVPGAFVRIGLFVLMEDHLDAFKDTPAASITLV